MDLKLFDAETSMAILLEENTDTLVYCSYVRGYHAYAKIWSPVVGDESLFCRHERDNAADKDAVAVIHDNLVEERVVGHVPANVARVFRQFLRLPGTRICVKVTAKRDNRGAGMGLEIPVAFIFNGDRRATAWVRKETTRIDNNVDCNLKYCMK